MTDNPGAEAREPSTAVRSIRPAIEHALTVYYDGNAEIARTLIDRLTAETKTVDSAPQYVYAVSEIRDDTLRRVHGHYASLRTAFAYCEAQERTPTTTATARFELFPAPSGNQWMIHAYYGPDDPCPEISDFVITRYEVVPDNQQ